MTDASDVRWLQDQDDWEAHQVPDGDPPPHDYDPAADGWIADWFGGKHD